MKNKNILAKFLMLDKVSKKFILKLGKLVVKCEHDILSRSKIAYKLFEY